MYIIYEQQQTKECDMTDKIKIDKDMLMPSRVSRGSKYPLGSMEVGDSFFSPKNIKYICTLIYKHRKKEPHKKYSSRTVEGGTRCWRVK